MKRLMSVLVLLVVSLPFSVAKNVRKCTEQDIPMGMRNEYIRHAEEMLVDYYSQLPLAIGDLMVQDVFTERFMLKDQPRYMPEFKPMLKDTDQYLTTDQYMSELDKVFGHVDRDEIAFWIEGITINPEDFYMPNMVSCYVTATYELVLTDEQGRLATRQCEAYCLFPRAMVSIDVKLMQVRPTGGNDYPLSKPVHEAAGDVSPPQTGNDGTDVVKMADETLMTGTEVTERAGWWHYLTNPRGGMLLLFFLIMGAATGFATLANGDKISDSILFSIVMNVAGIVIYTFIVSVIYYSIPFMPEWMIGFETWWYWIVALGSGFFILVSLTDLKEFWPIGIIFFLLCGLSVWMIWVNW